MISKSCTGKIVFMSLINNISSPKVFYQSSRTIFDFARFNNSCYSYYRWYQIYHNYIREHDGLNGKTPAEKCGIKIEGNDKWMTII